MKRRQIVVTYLLTSLSKRLWLVILPALVLGILSNVVGFPVLLSLSIMCLTALTSVFGIVLSSYRRHQHEFDVPEYIIVDPSALADS
ncbi:hypothetical protein MF271_16820 [Deinococcus sp. KNUC1210]|uniref:hypothetical protein n=1 Tax=Deinococcus sp. KNUC1210 TaxID=2917691 RepID=UPI001EF027B8|nr:hypothetical protein [Deinococcus sp. KNUC1210]ULH15550.1 hypothetical protein MF271_16820 [Deinococcus sp. KNUC1210]